MSQREIELATAAAAEAERFGWTIIAAILRRQLREAGQPIET